MSEPYYYHGLVSQYSRLEAPNGLQPYCFVSKLKGSLLGRVPLVH